MRDHVKRTIRFYRGGGGGGVCLQGGVKKRQDGSHNSAMQPPCFAHKKMGGLYLHQS